MIELLKLMQQVGQLEMHLFLARLLRAPDGGAARRLRRLACLIPAGACWHALRTAAIPPPTIRIPCCSSDFCAVPAGSIRLGLHPPGSRRHLRPGSPRSCEPTTSMGKWDTEVGAFFFLHSGPEIEKKKHETGTVRKLVET